MPTIGLRQRIESADSKEKISTLLDEGSRYEQASKATRSSWANTARRRLQQLTK
jgi:hypothetical protein